MSFRTVVIKNRCKLEYSLNQLIYRGENELKININEITSLIIQSSQVAITSALISKLIENKIKVIFCDSYHNPQCELIPYYGNYNVKEKITTQMSITKSCADITWKEIVYQKIFNQLQNLQYKGYELASEKLKVYLNEIEVGDISNREGHAAKVYFNALFGNTFSRDQKNDINAFLDYGYAILLSAINREIKNLGYLTEIGIHHIGNTNPFNLSCDFIEPLRPLVDFYVIAGKLNIDNFKKELVNLLNVNVFIDDKTMILDNAIRVYVQSLFQALIKEDIKEIKFIRYERV